MADDILGHDHLDHGKHLHHHAKHWAPGDRFGRGSRPVHIGLASANPLKERHPQLYSVHAPDAHAHLHVHHSFTHTHPGTSAAAHGHADNGIASLTEAVSARESNFSHGTDGAQTLAERVTALLPWLIAVCIALPVGILLYHTNPALSVFLIVLIVNTTIEYHKFFTEGIPIDFEILFATSAAMTVVYGLPWGIALILIAPTVAVAVRGHDWDTVPRKTGGLLITVLLANFIGSNLWGLFIAIAAGVVVHYLIIVAMGVNNGINTIIARLCVLGTNGYLAFFLLPTILHMHG